MKFTTIFVAVALTSATHTMADNCQRGLSYCGRTLLHKGNYADQIEAAVCKAHTNPGHMLDTLFYCIGGSNGDIEVIKDCAPGRCVDAGSDKSDICLASSRIHLILDMEESFSAKTEEDAWKW
ncbi:hypothetical protein B0H19DRAFT_1084119 [Mycena capillaripes]|nr:hypothetical protein B0H19DRAFT_1084119 [Mycena capillaripes]